MTAHEIYDQRIKRLPAIEQLRLAMVILEQLTGPADAAARTELALQQQIRGATPPNAALLGLAAKHRPPQSWWDESGDPFSPEDKAQ